jgi:hypothetical protein
MHWPFVHASVPPLGAAGHLCPHVPQLAISDPVFAQYPWLESLQTVGSELGQGDAHLPLWHVVVEPIGPVGQTYPQLPQLFRSVSISAHPLGHTT